MAAQTPSILSQIPFGGYQKKAFIKETISNFFHGDKKSSVQKHAEGLQTSVPNETPAQLAQRMSTGNVNVNKLLNTAVDYPWKSTGFPGPIVRGAARMLKNQYQANPASINPYLESLKKMPKEKVESIITANPDAFKGVSNRVPGVIPRVA